MKNKNIKTKFINLILATTLLFSGVVSVTQACSYGAVSDTYYGTCAERAMVYNLKKDIKFLDKIIKLKIKNRKLDIHISSVSLGSNLSYNFALLVDNSKADKNQLFFDYLNETPASKKIKVLPDLFYKLDSYGVKRYEKEIKKLKNENTKSIKIYKNSKVIVVQDFSDGNLQELVDKDAFHNGTIDDLIAIEKTFKKIDFKNHLEKNTFRINKKEDETIKIIAYLETKNPVFANIFYQEYEEQPHPYPENIRMKSKVLGYDRQKELYKHEIDFNISRSWLKHFKKYFGNKKFKVFELTLADPEVTLEDFYSEYYDEYFLKKLIFLDPSGFQEDPKNYR